MILRYLRGPIVPVSKYVLRPSALPVIEASPVAIGSLPAPEKRVEVINESFLAQLRSNRSNKEALHLVFAYSPEEESNIQRSRDVIEATMNFLEMPHDKYPRLVATHYNTAIQHQHMVCPAYDLRGKAAPALSKLSCTRIKDLNKYLAQLFPELLSLKRDPASRVLPRDYLKSRRIHTRKNPDREIVKPAILQLLEMIKRSGNVSPDVQLCAALRRIYGRDRFLLKGIKAGLPDGAFIPRKVIFPADLAICSSRSKQHSLTYDLAVTDKMLQRAFSDRSIKLSSVAFWEQPAKYSAKLVEPIIQRLEAALAIKKPSVTNVDREPLMIELRNLKKVSDKTRPPRKGTKQDPLGYGAFPVLRSEAPDFYALSRELLKLASLLGIPHSSLLGINIGQLLQLLSRDIHQLQFLPSGGTFLTDTFIPRNLRECHWPNRTAEERQELQDICDWVDAMTPGAKHSHNKTLDGFTFEIE